MIASFDIIISINCRTDLQSYMNSVPVFQAETENIYAWTQILAYSGSITYDKKHRKFHRKCAKYSTSWVQMQGLLWNPKFSFINQNSSWCEPIRMHQTIQSLDYPTSSKISSSLVLLMQDDIKRIKCYKNYLKIEWII